MNITILSLASSIFSVSPLFTGHRLSICNSNINHFNSVLFFNQKSHHLQNSIFYKGLSAILINEREEEEKVYTVYTNDNFTDSIFQINENLVKIEKCSFLKIQSNENIIFLKGRSKNLEISDSLFQLCSSNKGFICFQEYGTVEITNVIDSETKCERDGQITFFNLRGGDDSSKMNIKSTAIVNIKKIVILDILTMDINLFAIII